VNAPRQRREQTRSWRSRLRLLEAAIELFGERGYTATTFGEIAARAGVSTGLACRYFPTKEHFALALYARLASELARAAVEMPEGTIADRFAAVLRAKLELLEPHRAPLTALAGRAIDPDARAGVMSDASEIVRVRVAGVFAAAVSGATDAPAPREVAELARLLYGAHLGFVLLWLESEPGRIDDLVELGREAARFLVLFGQNASPESRARIERLFGGRVPAPVGEDVDARSRAILRRAFLRRRVHADVRPEPSEAAYALHLPRVRAFVERDEPVQIVLPAFPAKSPSPHKVLGPRADTAERLALEGLSELLDEIASIHPPGAELVICSDGHVFADVVGVRDRDVARYRADLEAMIAEIDPSRIRVFDLGDAFGESGARARNTLLARYGLDAEAIRERSRRSAAHRAQVDGVHRFVVEDEIALHPELSKSAIRKATRERAYEIVRRSDAWSRLLADLFPRALRFSIHPQPDVSEKIGVHLLATDDEWLTPWHGAAVLVGDRFRLMKRGDAEKLGARTVSEEDRASYLELSGAA
jgi:pyoverdine/dityrosine biosynthesis protein Dit1